MKCIKLLFLLPSSKKLPKKQCSLESPIVYIFETIKICMYQCYKGISVHLLMAHAPEATPYKPFCLLANEENNCSQEHARSLFLLKKSTLAPKSKDSKASV